MEIRRSYRRIISTMGFDTLVRRHHYIIKSGPRVLYWPVVCHMPAGQRLHCVSLNLFHIRQYISHTIEITLLPLIRALEKGHI